MKRFGQSGSGKTHTLFGPNNSGGIVQKSLELIFARAELLKKSGCTVSVYSSFSEISLDSVRDLNSSLGPDQMELNLSRLR